MILPERSVFDEMVDVIGLLPAIPYFLSYDTKFGMTSYLGAPTLPEHRRTLDMGGYNTNTNNYIIYDA